MTNTLPPFVAELEALEQKATRGPWGFIEADDNSWCAVEADGRWIADNISQGDMKKAVATDLEMIVVLRNAFPDLLALIRQLQGERDDYQRKASQMAVERDLARRERDLAERHAQAPGRIVDDCNTKEYGQ